MLKLTCEGCNKIREFVNAQEAFDEGWDCPPYFSFVITCDRCPSASILLAKLQATGSRPNLQHPIEFLL